MDDIQCLPVHDSNWSCRAMKKCQVALVVFGLTIAGFLIRIYHLDWQCLTVDEGVTYRVMSIVKDPVSIFFWSFQYDYNPPLYYLTACFSAMVFGLSDFAIRFPAVVFGTLLIPSMYFFGKELRNETLGILCSGISVFFFPYVYYSQNARAYSLVMLAFVWYMLIFVKVYRGDIRRETILCLAVFAGLCLFSHLYSIIPVTVSMLILAAKYRRLMEIVVYLSAIVALVIIAYRNVIALHIQYLPHLQHTAFWLSSQQIAMMLPNELFCWSWVFIIPMAIMFAISKIRDDGIYLAIIIIAAVTALSCLPMTVLTSMSPRYALLVSPVVLGVALCPAAAWVDRQDAITKKGALVGLIIFGLFLFNWGSLLSWFTFNTCPYMI